MLLSKRSSTARAKARRPIWLRRESIGGSLNRCTRSNGATRSSTNILLTWPYRADRPQKLTEAQAEYELARKNSELQERAQRTATQRAAVEREHVVASAQASAIAQQQAAVQQAAEQQARQQRSQSLMNIGLQILQWNHERELAAQLNRPQMCVWRQMGAGWVQQCM